MDERRQEERKKVMAFTPVADAGSGRLLGYLADLTLRGAMVIGEKHLEENSEVKLSIQFPSRLEGIPAGSMHIPARVARCTPDESPGSFRLGFEFTSVNDENKRIIEALLERYHFRHQM